MANKIHGIWIPINLLTESDLSKTALLLLADMATFDEYFKSREEIAKFLKVDKNYISKLLKELEKKGFIEKVGNVFNRNVYAVSEKTKDAYREAPPKSLPAVQKKDLSQFIQDIHSALGGDRKILATDSRIRKLKARLKNFTPEQILQSAYNLSQSPFHMGYNDNHVKYATVDFLLRSDEKVEQWLNADIADSRIERISRSVF